jgi:uncharacterized protein (TIGR03000 family)|tara:strand:+ start:9163 stop:10038 length:876 start_codon:yes stop_codon:yes gene_type:complete
LLPVRHCVKLGKGIKHVNKSGNRFGLIAQTSITEPLTMRQSIFATIVVAILFTASHANAGNVINPCCSRVVVCCGPSVVYRPILRNAIYETRLALHYHANYRYYRAPLFGPLLAPRIYSRVYYGSAVNISEAKPTVAKSTTKPGSQEYIDQPKGDAESRLVPIQPATPADEPVAPIPAADEPKLEQPGTEEADDGELPQPAVKINPTATTLHLQVPHDAQVTINGFRTKTTGTRRDYISSNLDPAKTYQYDIEIVWHTATGVQRQLRSTEMMPGNISSFSILETPSSLVKK